MPLHQCHCPPVRNAQSLLESYRGNTGGAHDEEGSDANVFCSDRVHRRSFCGGDKRSSPPPCLPKADTRALLLPISASQSVDTREGRSRRTEEEEVAVSSARGRQDDDCIGRTNGPNKRVAANPVFARVRDNIPSN